LNRDRLFSDEQFAWLYCPNNGRSSVPPSLLAVALLLQAHDKVSDEEAVSRARFDVRWMVALGTEVCGRPFAKSTLLIGSFVSSFAVVTLVLTLISVLRKHEQLDNGLSAA